MRGFFILSGVAGICSSGERLPTQALRVPGKGSPEELHLANINYY